MAAPDTEKGVVPNHRGFASDLETALQILAGVRLGNGNVTVKPNELYLAGHGMGASAAVLAATGRSHASELHGYETEPTLAGVMAVFPSDTSPSAYEAAKHVMAPGLILEAGRSGFVPAGDAKRMAAQWKGDVVYRELEKASAPGFHEKFLQNFAFGFGAPQFAQQELVRALITGFALAERDHKFKEFREQNVKLKGTQTHTARELYKELPENADLLERIQSLNA